MGCVIQRFADEHFPHIGAPFESSLDSLLNYVFEANLDGIAITNQNLFRKEQLDILCFPGIEIDIEKAQILLFADGQDLDGFAKRCEEIEGHFSANDSPITFEELKTIFEKMMTTAHKEDFKEFSNLNFRFHNAILEASKNNTLMGMWKDLHVQCRTQVNTHTCVS